MIQGKQLSNNLEQKKKRINELEQETEYLNKQIQLALQEQIKQDGLVEEARSEQKQSESRKN